MGRELLRIGAPFRQPEWSALALMEGPDWVLEAHTNFIDAGSEIITTNSYALVPFHIGEVRFAEHGQSLADLSGRVAREAATSSSSKVQVAGSLPPLFGSYRPDLFDTADAPRIIDPLVEGLAPHVDFWLAETLACIAEAFAVREALTRAGADQPVWMSFTLADDPAGRLRSGEAVADAVLAAVSLGAEAVLFNCCSIESITAAIATATSIVPTNVAVGGYANRFETAHANTTGANAGLSEFRTDVDPLSYSEIVNRWVADGATVVGGCCGIEPAHIAAIKASIG